MRGIIDVLLGLFAINIFLNFGGYRLLDYVRRETLTAVHREITHGYDDFGKFNRNLTGLKMNADPNRPLFTRVDSKKKKAKKSNNTLQQVKTPIKTDRPKSQLGYGTFIDGVITKMEREKSKGPDVIDRLIQYMEKSKKKL